MKKFLFFLSSLLIGIFIFWWVLKTVGWLEIKNSFLVFTFWQGILILILTFGKILTATWKWKEILKSEEIDLHFSNLLPIYLSAFSITYLFPTAFLGGEIFQGYILKRKYSVSWSKGIAASFSDQILDWTTNLIVIIFGILFFVFKIAFLPTKITIICFIIFPLILFAICYFYFKAFKKESIIGFIFQRFSKNFQNNELLKTEKEVFNFFNFKKSFFWKGIFIAFFEEIFFLLRIWFLVSFFGKNLDFLTTLFILSFSYLAMMVPIPAVLGIHEGIQVFAFETLKLGAGLGTALALIIRGADLILSLFGICISFKLGSELLKRELFKT